MYHTLKTVTDAGGKQHNYVPNTRKDIQISASGGETFKAHFRYTPVLEIE